jgi:parvulin-like peptidyl-prolyl isomerase
MNFEAVGGRGPAQPGEQFPRQANASGLIRRLARTAAAALALAIGPFPAAGQDQPGQSPPPGSDASSGGDVLATVNGEAVTRREVERTLTAALGRRRVADAVRVRLSAETLKQAVDQRLVMARLSALDQAAGEVEVRAALDALKADLKARRSTYAEHLAKEGLTEEEHAREYRWQLTWRRFLKTQLTDQALETWFDAHRREFDGTQLRVSHILWPLDPGASKEEAAAAEARALSLREKIVSGQVSFADAARTESSGPSKEKGGDLGFIPRRGPMVEEFSEAAFALETGGISQPVRSPFGIHLILCAEERRGSATWSDVRDALSADLSRQLFREMADEERNTARIEFTGAGPYIDSKTGEVVVP